MKVDDTVLLLKENTHVRELFEIFKFNKVQGQLRDLNSVLDYVEAMENQLNAVAGELASVKQELEDVKDKQHPIRAAFKNIVNTLEKQISDIRERINDVKASIIDGAKKTVNSFKENGISALNNITKFLKIKTGLNIIKDDLQKAIKSAEKSIAKIDTASTEYHEIGKHIKNMVNALTGKEAVTDVKANGKLSKAVQAPYRAANAVRSKAEKGVTALINKVENLETAAAKIQTKEKKPSILQNIKDYKAPPKVAADPEKSKKQEVCL